MEINDFTQDQVDAILNNAVLGKEPDKETESLISYAGCVKLKIGGSTFAFPGNNDLDPQDENWSIENLKSRTFDEFRVKIINFLIAKSTKLTETERKVVDLNDTTNINDTQLTGNLIPKDISFRLHYHPVKEKHLGKILTLEEAHKIGDVLELRIIRDRNDIILPAWIRYIESKKGKRATTRKGRNKWQRLAEQYNEKTGKGKEIKSSIDRWNLQGVDWTFKLELNKEYINEIDEINKTLKSQRELNNGNNGSNNNSYISHDIEYIRLNEDEKLDSKSEITVPCDITVGKLRERIFDLLWLKNSINRNNMWLQNIRFNKNDVSLKIKYSKLVKEFNDAEAKKAGRAKNGDTIKIGIIVPLWYKVVLMLNTITMAMLNDDNEEQKQVKDEINSVVELIRNER